MRRRELMVFLGSALAAARPLRAQQKLMPVIGFLSSTSSAPVSRILPLFTRDCWKPAISRGRTW
jgi:hypothetical protein